MAILTPSQLVSASNATYFNNVSGSITPDNVRNLNDNWISSSILVSQTSSLSVLSSSYALTASFALNAGTSIDTGSFVNTSSFNTYTASINGFTGSIQTQVNNLQAATASYITSAQTSSMSVLSSSYALTASFALNGGGTVDTASFATTGSNTFTADQTITTDGNTDLTLQSTAGSGQVNLVLDAFQGNVTSKGLFAFTNNGQFGGSGSMSFVVKDNDIAFGATQGFRLGVTNAIGNGLEGGSVQINVPSGSQQLQLTGSLNVTNGIIVNQGALITGSARLRPEYVSTEQPFVINQVSDGTSTGANLIAVRNTSTALTGSFTISGSSNIFLAAGGPGNTGTINGNQFGFNGRGNIVETTSIILVSGSSSNPTKVLPTITNTFIGAAINVNDNRPSASAAALNLQTSNIGSTFNYTTSTGSTLVNNLFNLSVFTLTVTGSNGATKSLGSTMIVGSATMNVDSPTGSALGTGLLVAGNNNTLLSSGSNFNFTNASILGGQLALTGSTVAPFGSTFVGRFNATDSTAILSNTVFGVGTGTAAGSRRTSLHVSASGLTTISDGLNIAGGNATITGNLEVTGSTTLAGLSTFNQLATFNTQTVFNQNPSFNTQANFGNVLSFTASRFAATVNNTNDLEALSENSFGYNIRSKNFTTSGSSYQVTVDTGSNFTSQTFRSQYGGTEGSVVLSNNSGSTAFTVSASNIELIGNTGVTGNLTILSGSGDLFLYGNKQFNGAQYSSTTTQSGSSAVSQSVTFNTNGVQYGLSLVDNTKITVANAGTYNIQFSAQILADTGADDVWIWFKKNGANIANSATRLALSNNEEDVITVNILEEAAASDYFEIVWESANGDAVLLAEAAAGNYPAIPSIIATVTQVR